MIKMFITHNKTEQCELTPFVLEEKREVEGVTLQRWRCVSCGEVVFVDLTEE